MEAKHTPGPWVADIRTGVFAVYPESEDRGGCLAECVKNEIARQFGKGEPAYEGGYCLLTEDQEANARLIAAAPELLSACESIISDTCGNCVTCVPPECSNGCENLIRAKKAIAKAKGEA